MRLIRRRRRFEESGPYWQQRSWQLSAAFLGVVVLLGGFVALTSESGGDSAVASEGPLVGDLTRPDERPPGCRTDDRAGDALPKKAPEDITWRTFGASRVPVSASAGPTRTTGPVHWCYAHTPMGAVLAATVITSQMSGSGWETVSRQQVVAGSGRDMFEFKRSAYQDIDSAQSGGISVGSAAGFSVASYTGEAADIGLLIRSAQGYSATIIRLRWSDGDWKVLPDDSGELHTPVNAIQGTPRDYIMWGV
ncbi:hypothetical protein [Streptomyces fumanus]|uniref:DUF8175 domain-containing protein n=1 Tax=Streptomyces fumanus TaxID=67302 RepID=A0A919DWD7_9ACTN|nr:hypothetical protein [Streptomyces fumanus]GHE85301.1 hypothetical protein GCM10018772_05650 [Streptomyces fumanus]